MTNEKAPERFWIALVDMEAVMDADLFTEPPNAESVEYVRADLLATVRKEEREAAFKDAQKAIDEAATKCPVFVFHSKQGKEFLTAALEAALSY